MEDRGFPCDEVKLLASSRSRGKAMTFRGSEYLVAEACPDSFSGVDIAFFCASGDVARTLAPAAVARGAVVIDNSSAFRMDEGVPLIVPEINASALAGHRGIIANPNCSTIILAVALKPLHDKARVKRVVVSTYQAASGAGIEAVEELEAQIRAHVDKQPIQARILPSAADKRHYQLAFNVIPQVDLFQEDGYTREEAKMIHETRKIFDDHSLQVSPTTVRVPVMWCHSESVNVETHSPLSASAARELLSQAEGVVVLDDVSQQLYPMPVNFPDRDEVFVGRIREDLTQRNTLNMWVVGNQLRKGAATNAVQIAERLIAK
jgi:aspartate-semialdehyde dehydrogenase